jgi:hypothetical protein
LAQDDPMTQEFGDMKKIMYPVMGVIFGILWVILAFVAQRLDISVDQFLFLLFNHAIFQNFISTVGVGQFWIFGLSLQP